MQGSLALAHHVLWVGRQEKTAHVRAYDLDGRPLGTGFSFRDDDALRAEVTGLAVDHDHKIWIADRPTSRLRVFTVFGAEVARFEGAGAGDRPLPIEEPVDVCLLGGESDDDPFLLIASGGTRRHAAHVIESSGRLVVSLRPLGDPLGRFRGVRRVGARGRFAYVCEAAAGRIQVFRDLEFHFALGAGERDFRPVAVAAHSDGRLFVASAGAASRLLVFDRGGRLRGALCGPGKGEGEVSEPSALALDEAGTDRESRLFVLDRDGDRVQVFSLEGRCFGAFEELLGGPA